MAQEYKIREYTKIILKNPEILKDLKKASEYAETADAAFQSAAALVKSAKKQLWDALYLHFPELRAFNAKIEMQDRTISVYEKHRTSHLIEEK